MHATPKLAPWMEKSEKDKCGETVLGNYDLVSCEGYLKNGALASLGLGRGSGAYYGSVELSCQQCFHGANCRMFSMV